MTFDKELALKWIAMLREPDRRQAKHRLVVRDSAGNKSQCCLGVACEAAGMVEVKEIRHGNAISYQADTPARRGKKYGGELPKSLRSRLGLDENDEGELVSMNDIKQDDFYVIADWLEENYKSKGLI